jgi:hypothetical protein
LTCLTQSDGCKFLIYFSMYFLNFLDILLNFLIILFQQKYWEIIILGYGVFGLAGILELFGIMDYLLLSFCLMLLLLGMTVQVNRHCQ